MAVVWAVIVMQATLIMIVVIADMLVVAVFVELRVVFDCGIELTVIVVNYILMVVILVLSFVSKSYFPVSDDTEGHVTSLLPSCSKSCFRSPTATWWTTRWSTMPTCSGAQTPVHPVYPISPSTPPSQVYSPPSPPFQGRPCCAAHGACSKRRPLPVPVPIRFRPPRRDTIHTSVRVTVAPSTARTATQRTTRNR